MQIEMCSRPLGELSAEIAILRVAVSEFSLGKNFPRPVGVQ
jgi:hypothetical protein